MRIPRILASAALLAGVCAFASDAVAQLTYFDANVTGYQVTTKTGVTVVDPNTTLVDGSSVPITEDASGIDGIWRIRRNNGFGNKPDPDAENIGGEEYLGDILEARGSFDNNNTEDVPTLKTTVDVPSGDQGQEKAVYAFFWSDGAAWQIAASLTNSNDGQPSTSNPIQPVFAANNAGVDYDVVRNDNSDALYDTYVRPVYDASDSGGTPDGFGSVPIFFPTDSLLTTSDGDNMGGPAGNRRLWVALLGNTTLGPELTVYVGEGFLDPLNGTDLNHRTWYDGIGYGDPVPGAEPLPNVIPEPSTVVLLGVATAIGIAAVRRR